MGKAEVKNTHIIPQTYLKQFLAMPFHNQKEKSVFIAYKNDFNDWQRAGIKNKPFSTYHFYDFSSINEKTQTVENYLCNHIETKYQRIIEKISNEEILEDEDLTNLFRFIITMRYRTKRMQQVLQEPIDKLRQYSKDFEMERNKEVFKEFFSVTCDYSKIWLLGTDRILEQSLFNKNSIFIIHNNTEIPFITSDNPINLDILGEYEIVYGLGLPYKNSEEQIKHSILFPMSPQILFFYCNCVDSLQIESHRLELIDSNIAFRFNSFQIRNCDSFIISNRNDTNINYAKFYEDILAYNNQTKEKL